MSALDDFLKRVDYEILDEAIAELAQLRAELDKARRAIEHVLRANETDQEWDAQELVDWLEKYFPAE